MLVLYTGGLQYKVPSLKTILAKEFFFGDRDSNRFLKISLKVPDCKEKEALAWCIERLSRMRLKHG